MATKGRPPSRVPLGLTKGEFETVLHALKVSIDESLSDSYAMSQDGTVHPKYYTAVSKQMAAFTHISNRYQMCFCKDKS